LYNKSKIEKIKKELSKQLEFFLSKMGNIGGIFAGANVNTNNQTAETTIANSIASSCRSNCTNIIAGLNLSVVGGSGDITIDQVCSASAACVETAALTTLTDTAIKGIQAGQITAIPTILGVSIGVNVNTSAQTVRQAFESSIDQQCNTSVLNQATGVDVTIVNHDGSFAFNQNGDATATCVEKAASTIQATLQESISQTGSVGFNLNLGTIILLIVVIIVIIVILYFAFKKPKPKNTNSSSQKTTSKSSSQNPT
jgi:hypothetical protein